MLVYKRNSNLKPISMSVYKRNSSEIIIEELYEEVKPSLCQLSVNPVHASGSWVKKQQSSSNVMPTKARTRELILRECKISWKLKGWWKKNAWSLTDIYVGI